MTLANAVKENKAIEVELDTYLLDDNRILKYNRYYTKTKAMWIDEVGNVFKNFCDAYNSCNAVKWA